MFFGFSPLVREAGRSPAISLDAVLTNSGALVMTLILGVVGALGLVQLAPRDSAQEE